jgi:diguanylate cyclase (GGDEF)-like protein
MVEMFIAHLDEFEREMAEILPTPALDLQTDRQAPSTATSATPGSGLATDRPAGAYLERISSAHREFTTLYQMAHSVASSIELDTTLGIVTEQLHKLIFFDTCVIYLTLPEGGAARARYADGPGGRALENRKIAFGEGLTGWVLANQEHFYNTDPALDLDGVRDEECEAFRNLYVFPLIKDQETLGAVALYSLSTEVYTPDHVRLIEMATPMVTDAVNNALCYARREEDAMTDELTGLANSRALYLFSEKEISRCRRSASTLTILMMDLDRFKQVNDMHGHRAGSRMLSEIGPLIAETLRTADFVARYGGDEFFALLPDTNYEQAQIVIQRIEEAVNNHQMKVEGGQLVSVGISIGAAEFGRDGQTLEELLIKADLAMYTTKAQRKLGRHKLEQTGELVRSPESGVRSLPSSTGV